MIIEGPARPQPTEEPAEDRRQGWAARLFASIGTRLKLRRRADTTGHAAHHLRSVMAWLGNALDALRYLPGWQQLGLLVVAGLAVLQFMSKNPPNVRRDQQGDVIPYDIDHGALPEAPSGALLESQIEHFNRWTDLGSIDGHHDAVRQVMEQDYASIVRQGAATVTCRYAAGDGAGRERHYKFWYQFRPPEADPDHARTVAADSPLLKIAAPVNQCPANDRLAARQFDAPPPVPYDWNRDKPGSTSWDPHAGVWH